MNKDKLDNKLFELTERFSGGDVSVKDLKEVLEALLEEPEHVPYGHPLFGKHIKKQING